MRRFGRERLAKEQCGFIGGVGIEVCRKRLIDRLMEMKRRKERAWVLFVDFSAAYNRVDRKRLKDLMEKRKIFTKEDDFILWKFLASKTEYEVGGRIIRTSNGVPQGSSLSPMAFNV